HLYVQHAHQPHHIVEHRDIGGADLLALDVDRAIAHRQRIDNFGRSNDSRRERLIKLEGPGLVERDDDMAHPVAFAPPGARLRIGRGAIDRKRQPGRRQEQRHERQEGPCTPNAWSYSIESASIESYPISLPRGANTRPAAIT